MANRRTRLVIKNNSVPSAPFTGATLLQGEAIVNTADGVMMFSGITQSISNWTPAGTGVAANFFEVGSNLYDLQLRNRLTKYENISGAGLVNKFLSGTTNGFVLADISSIIGVDTYVTGFTYSNNALTIKQNNGQPDRSVIINTMTGLTINGNLIVTGTTNLNGSSNYNQVVSGVNPNEIANVNFVTGYTQNIDVYVTGNTYTGATNNTNNTTFGLLYHGTPLNGPYILTAKDTYVTGTTWTPNLLTSKRNDGTSISTLIDTFSALTISNLTPNRLVYTTTGGALITGTAIFDGTDMTLPTSGSLRVGTGGLVVGSGGSITGTGIGDVVIHGNLTVFGSAISAFTSQLYVEDNNIFLNYNPSGSTVLTSVGAGWTIQDGSGISGSNVNLDIRAMNGFTGLTSNEAPDTSEYTGSTGYSNRAWVTQLNDIVIRSTDPTIPNGVRVLAEFDILDGGSY